MKLHKTADFDQVDGDTQPDETALAIARQVQALVAKDPKTPLLEIFDLAVECRRGSAIEFGDLLGLESEDVFVDLVMEAFSPQTEEHARLSLSEDPDDQARAAELEEFRDSRAVAAFFRRYELSRTPPRRQPST